MGRRAVTTPPLADRAARASWWGALEIASRHAVQLGVTLVLARLLAPADFGLVAMLLVFTSLGALLVDSGLGAALVQRGASSDDEETSVFMFSVAMGVGVAGLLWLAAPAVAAFYRQPRLVELMAVAVLVVPVAALAVVPDALLSRSLDFRTRARAEAVSSATAGAVAITLAWRGHGVWSLAWMPPVTAAMRALLLWAATGWRPRGRFDRVAFGRLFGFGGYMLAANLLDVVSLRLQSLLLGRLFDARVLGYFTLAQNTEQAPASFIGTLLNRVGLPVLSSVAGDRDRLREALRRALRLSMFVFLPVMVGIALAAPPLVSLLYGPGWNAVAPILAVLALGSSLWPLHVLNLAAINALGRADLFLRLTVVKKAIAIPLVLIAAPHGPVAIAWALLAAGIVGVVANTWFAHRMVGYGLLAQMRDQGATVAGTAFAAATGWFSLDALPVGGPWLIVAGLASAATYLLVAIVLRNPALDEVRMLSRRALA